MPLSRSCADCWYTQTEMVRLHAWQRRRHRKAHAVQAHCPYPGPGLGPFPCPYPCRGSYPCPYHSVCHLSPYMPTNEACGSVAAAAAPVACAAAAAAAAAPEGGPRRWRAVPAALQTGLLKGLSWQARPGPKSGRRLETANQGAGTRRLGPLASWNGRYSGPEVLRAYSRILKYENLYSTWFLTSNIYTLF